MAEYADQDEEVSWTPAYINMYMQQMRRSSKKQMLNQPCARPCCACCRLLEVARQQKVHISSSLAQPSLLETGVNILDSMAADVTEKKRPVANVDAQLYAAGENRVFSDM